MILIFPGGSWRELLPEDQLVCEDPYFRDVEKKLRMRIYTLRYRLCDRKDLQHEQACRSYRLGVGDTTCRHPGPEGGVGILTNDEDLFRFEETDSPRDCC